METVVKPEMVRRKYMEHLLNTWNVWDEMIGGRVDGPRKSITSLRQREKLEYEKWEGTQGG